MFECFAKDTVTLDKDWIECDDTDTVQDMIDEGYGCIDCDETESLEFVEVGPDAVWLQCKQCAWESFCENKEAERTDDYMDYGYDDKDEVYFEG